jgi:hypothetical protein
LEVRSKLVLSLFESVTLARPRCKVAMTLKYNVAWRLGFDVQNNVEQTLLKRFDHLVFRRTIK